MKVVGALSKHIYQTLNATELKIQQNNEVHGCQEVFHTHSQIIPLYENDGFMTGESTEYSHEELLGISREIL